MVGQVRAGWRSSGRIDVIAGAEVLAARRRIKGRKCHQQRRTWRSALRQACAMRQFTS